MKDREIALTRNTEVVYIATSQEQNCHVGTQWERQLKGKLEPNYVGS